MKGEIVMEDPTIKEKEIDNIISRCKGAMDVSFYKYGPAKKNFGEGRVDAIKSIDLCLMKFNKTKNIEYLQDVINYALFRILYPLPVDIYKITDSDASAGVVGTPINME